MIILKNYSLQKHNTFGIDVKTKYFFNFQSIKELQRFIKNEKYFNFPQIIIGEGSNLLFTKNFEGVVIYPQIKGIELISQTDNFYFVKAGAGIIWDNFVEYCVKNNWQGAENLSLIPGTVGATPVQNIGAYGVEAKDIIHSVEYVSLQNGEIYEIENKNCKFEYRDSIFKNILKNKMVVTNVVFKLNKKHIFNIDYKGITDELKHFKEINIQNIRDAIIKVRNSKLPDIQKIGNAGSFFKNPVIDKKILEKIKEKYPQVPSFKLENNKYKIPAAYLIDKSELKGYRSKNVKVFENQPLVIVNCGNATGKEILELSKIVQSKVKQNFDIELEREVILV